MDDIFSKRFQTVNTEICDHEEHAHVQMLLEQSNENNVYSQSKLSKTRAVTFSDQVKHCVRKNISDLIL